MQIFYSPSYAIATDSFETTRRQCGLGTERNARVLEPPK
jgi:hypothetical protein